MREFPRLKREMEQIQQPHLAQEQATHECLELPHIIDLILMERHHLDLLLLLELDLIMLHLLLLINDIKHINNLSRVIDL